MEIVFYDLETSMPGQGQEILEFGAVVLSATGLEEVDSFTTLVRPSVINPNNAAISGISSAPSFSQIADRVHALLHGKLSIFVPWNCGGSEQAGRVWAGHNILRFDNVRIKEAFASIGRPRPEALGFIDTLHLLRRTFGQRAGNLKLSTLATYFGLGKQEHRSLADVRMNIEVLKLCATVLFMESNFPDIFQSSPQAPQKRRRSSYGSGDEFDFRLVSLSLEEAMQQLEGDEGEAVDSKMQNGKQDESERFLQPHEVLVDSIYVIYDGGPSVILLHGSDRLRVQVNNARVKFSVSDRFAFNETGKPTFTIVIIPSSELLAIVKHCEAAVKNKCTLLGINAAWQPASFVTKDGHEAIRIRIGTNGEGSSATYTTKLYSNLQEVQLGSVDPKSFREAVPAGCVVDAAIRLDAYAFERGRAGLKLLAEKLILH